MKTYKLYAICASWIILVSCCVPKDIAWQPEVIVDSDMCMLACENIGQKKLNCEEGMPIELYEGACKSGIDELTCVSCKKFCIDTQSTGVWLQPSCVATIKSCADIEKCQMINKK